MLLTGLFLLPVLSLLSYTTQVPKGGTTHCGLSLPISLNNPDNALQTCPQANPIDTIPQLRFLPIPKCVKLTPKANLHILAIRQFSFSASQVTETTDLPRYIIKGEKCGLEKNYSGSNAEDKTTNRMPTSRLL